MATKVDTARGNGRGRLTDGQLRLEPPARRARLPEIIVGLALMVGFALTAVLWHTSTTEKEAALALANPVVRGQVIEASDLRVVYLATDDTIATLGESDAAAVVGARASVDLPAGTLLTPNHVTTGVALGPEEGVVGLALDPGQVPASTVVPGDVVNVIAGPGGQSGASLTVGANLLASGAIVYAVEDIGTQGKRFVSIKLGLADANRVAAAAEGGPVRLVLVGEP